MDDTSCACVVFDIDGTISDPTHRLHHLVKRPKDWDAFNGAMGDDKPVMAMCQLLAILSNHYPIILCTGRQDAHRTTTTDWLERHGIPWTELHMRTTNDHRPNVVAKKELMHTIMATGWRPLFVVEDDKDVVAMWRGMGLVCLACTEGETL